MFRLVLLTLILIWLSSCAFKDYDNDGLLGNWDACPNLAEDLDAWQDHDGCPDLDNDEDSVSDSLDACKFIPEDMDGFEDEDGCPEDNNDLDSLKDFEDKCPNEAEDYDGFLDSDGCPDFDNDRDKIIDSLDSCPFEPEDKDSFEDLDGCPDMDNDKDGVLDEADACPNQVGVKRVYIEGQKIGCPELTTILRIPDQLSIPLSFDPKDALTMVDKIILRDQLIQSLIQFKDQKVNLKVFMLQGEKNIEDWVLGLNTRLKNLQAFIISEGIENFRVKSQVVDAELVNFLDQNNQSLNKIKGVEITLIK